MNVRRCLLWISLIAASASTLSAKENLRSRWLDRVVTIDGMMDDWQDAMVKAGDSPAALGIMNDGTHLYICLKSWDERANFQALSRGLILRVNPKGGDGDGLGIRFPVGIDDAGGGPRRRPQPGGGGRPPGADRVAREKAMEGFKDSLDVLEILESGEDHGQRLAVDAALGFGIRADLSAGMLTYEVKIPLKSSADEPHALGVEPGKVVTLSFETPKVDIEAIRPSRGPTGAGRGGGMRGGGGPGGGRGGGRMRGGGPGGRNPDPGEPIKIKAKIHLAGASPG